MGIFKGGVADGVEDDGDGVREGFVAGRIVTSLLPKFLAIAELSRFKILILLLVVSKVIVVELGEASGLTVKSSPARTPLPLAPAPSVPREI